MILYAYINGISTEAFIETNRVLIMWFSENDKIYYLWRVPIMSIE